MNRLQTLRNEIYNQFQNSSAGPQYFFQPENADVHAAYYTAMYLVQDTAEAVDAHMARGFSSDAMFAYIEFWGVMQAIEIQQDAIIELHTAVVGCTHPQPAKTSAWSRLRDKRNLLAGHPAKRKFGVPATQRAFMGRNFGTYRSIKYEMFDAQSSKTTHPTFNLRQMIDEYDAEAAQVLDKILAAMKSRWAS